MRTKHPLLAFLSKRTVSAKGRFFSYGLPSLPPSAPRSTNIPRPLSNIDQEPAVRNKICHSSCPGYFPYREKLSHEGLRRCRPKGFNEINPGVFLIRLLFENDVSFDSPLLLAPCCQEKERQSVSRQFPAHREIKFFSSFTPSFWLFSGWNWVATRLPRLTAAAKRTP